ncbi:DddA-like double-stranded DNA deaminase toxin [Amycolatopsis tucumanensis]|nr:DddA-like double-stranded DNA deaminase toxin [Amycolatopsis tucumanensis]MCF6424955.1 hypothetical protein [Amycolatopsis tucumanensis]
MSVDELAERLHRALACIGMARRALRTAAGLTGEAAEHWGQAFAGATGEGATLPSEAGNAAQEMTGNDSTLGVVEAMLQRYLEILGATSARPAVGPSAPNDRASKESPTAEDHSADDAVAAARAELPPPIRRGERGRKTHGRWWTPDGATVPIVSGRDPDQQLVDRRLEDLGMPLRPVTRSADVEMKLAAHMAANHIRHATVVINNRPCTGPAGCDTLVPVLLPKGSTLTVHGVKPDGQPLVKVYRGGARPWWS